MKITYIHHSSFCVETEDAVLLFDYFKGKIPSFFKEKPLFVFASHAHGDHYTTDIFKLAEVYPNIRYVLSNDIRISDLFLERHGYSKEVKARVTKVSKNQIYQIEGITVETLRSTDAGVAYMVSNQEMSIYHGGDLNWWRWEGEPQEDNLAMEQAYKEEIGKIEGRHFDVAFLPLDTRQEQNYALGFDYFMKHTETAVVFPMHFWGDFAITEKIRHDPCSVSYRDKINSISLENQTFCYKKGGVVS